MERVAVDTTGALVERERERERAVLAAPAQRDIARGRGGHDAARSGRAVQGQAVRRGSPAGHHQAAAQLPAQTLHEQ